MKHHLTLTELSTGFAVVSATILAVVQGFWAALLDVGLVVGAMATILAAVAAAGRTRPIRALVRRLITEPVDEWAEHAIQRHTRPLAEQLSRHTASLLVLAEVITDDTTRGRYIAVLEEAPHE